MMIMIDHRSFLIFRPTSQVDILETVCPNYLKFDVRIVLYQVPFQIKLHVIRTNRFRDIDHGSWPKNRSFLLGPPFTMIVWWSMIADKWSITIIDHHDDRDHRSRSVMIDGPCCQPTRNQCLCVEGGVNFHIVLLWNPLMITQLSSLFPIQPYITYKSELSVYQPLDEDVQHNAYIS